MYRERGIYTQIWWFNQSQLVILNSISMQGNEWDHNGSSKCKNPWEEGCNDI